MLSRCTFVEIEKYDTKNLYLKVEKITPPCNERDKGSNNSKLDFGDN